jgi:benzylsuccinate CoA-transferase BbsF subunit
VGGALDLLDGPPVRVDANGGPGLPLHGVRVIEVGTGAVAPEIARLLGVLGADVIKLESRTQVDFMRLQGPNIEASPGWASSNRNKRSVGIDLKHSDGRTLARSLARVADVIVENNTAGVMERLGLGYQEVATSNPRIVYLSSQAFGATGPAAGFGGFGPTNQAVSGTTYLWNHPGMEKPEGVSAIHPDHILGRMGSMAVVAALDEVRRSGRGQHIDLGQAEFAMACIGEAFIESSRLGRTVEPRGNASPIGAPHGVFPCLGDDQWIAITVENSDHWGRLAKLVGEESWSDPALATAEGRMACRDLLEAQLGAWTSQFTNVQLMRNLQQAGVPAAAAYSTVQAQADVHLNERGYFDTVTHPVLGTLRMGGVPYKAENLRHEQALRAPLLGQHTNDVLREWLSLPEASIAKLTEAGALT